MLTEVDSLKAIASRRFIFARWFFLFVGILIIGYQTSFDSTALAGSVAGPAVGLLFGGA
ncbi:MAG: Histidine kinase protein, partial [Patescibacteria group bacterium]|nr:Histidine kinase protein [Patescibacteria group bacterium]